MRPLSFDPQDRKSTRLNSSHLVISYAVFCLKKNKIPKIRAGDRFDVGDTLALARRPSVAVRAAQRVRVARARGVRSQHQVFFFFFLKAGGPPRIPPPPPPPPFLQ